MVSKLFARLKPSRFQALQILQIIIYYFFRNPSKTFEGSWVTPKWPVHTAYGKEFLTLDTNNTSIGVGPRLEQCAFWKNYVPDLTAILSRVDLDEFPIR